MSVAAAPPDGTPLQIAFLYVGPWQHEFEAHRRGEVPSHRLFFAHEMKQLGHRVSTFDVGQRGTALRHRVAWRLRQAWWAAHSGQDVIVATHEAASYLSLALRRLGLSSRKTAIVVLSVALPSVEGSRTASSAVKRWLLRSADLITVYSSDQLELLRPTLGRRRTAFLPLGVDTTFFTPPPTRRTASDVLAVGTNPGKDYATLVRALPPKRSLVIVTDSENIQRATPFVGHKDVTFRSDVPIAELRDMYSSCAVLVLPLRDAQMSSGQTVLLENLALGTPVIATDTACIRDYVQHESVTLVAEGSVDELREALSRPAREGAFAEAFEHSATATAVALARMLQEVTDQ